ncbi:MAG: hypothetical protein ACYTXF_11820 [Nostoc sp.]
MPLVSAQKLPEVLPEALAAARAIRSEDSRANALSALVEKLPRSFGRSPCCCQGDSA